MVAWMRNIVLVFSFAFLQYITSTYGFVHNVAFQSPMAEFDTVKSTGVLSTRKKPFLLLAFNEVEARNTDVALLRISVQGRRRQISIKGADISLLSRRGSIAAGEEFNLILRLKADNMLAIYLHDSLLYTVQLKSSINSVAMSGTYRKGQIFKGKWNEFLCMSDNRDCGRTRVSMEIQPGLCPPKITPQRQRIVGGDPTDGGEHPWQVSFRYRYRATEFPHACGGTLIDNCWVVSAAHCFQEYKSENVFVARVGDYYNRNDQEKTYRNYENSEDFLIKKVIKHHAYWTVPSSKNDIALIHLRENEHGRCAKFGDFVQPICLPTRQAEFAHEECVITGWGASERGQSSGEYPACLQKAIVALLDEAKCKLQYTDIKGAGPRIIDDIMQCAESEKKGTTDACQGDSGGPLVCSHDGGTGPSILWGITSWGDGCGTKYGVYTKVFSFRDWMDTSMLKYCKYNP